MSIEQKIQEVFKTVLDINPAEIKNDQPLDSSLGMDSTEMVEINVALKKEFTLDFANNEIKKGMTFDQVIEFLKEKGGQ